jgi:large subunit ribosomal protein L23
MGLLEKMSRTKKTTAPEKAPSSDTPKKTTRARASASTSTTPSGTSRSGAAFRVLLKPVLSEKAATLESKHSYVFVVKLDATKEDIKRAVAQVYGVRPHTVRTMRFDGKNVRFGAYAGRRGAWKKAIVTLRAGESIRIHEGV